VIVALVSVDVAVINHDLLLVREAVTEWNAVARVIISGTRLLWTSILKPRSHQHSYYYIELSQLFWFVTANMSVYLTTICHMLF